MNKLPFFLIVGVAIVCVVLYLFLFSQAPKDVSNHLRVNLSEGDPTSLHPHMSADIRARILGKSLFEGLTRLGKNGHTELAGAEKVEISPAKTQYVFTIRPQLWSNGKPVNAYHFESAWKKVLHPDSICPRADLLYILKNGKKAKLNEIPLEEVGVKALNEKTLIVDLEHPAPYFLQLISHPIFSPLANDEKEPTIFNGPFKIGDWKHGRVMELIRNSSYWDVANVALSKISIFMVTDPHTEYSMFEKNELDIVGDTFDSIPLDVLSSAMKDEHFQTQEISRVYWIYFNTLQPPFQSAKIRKAFAYALDRKDLTENFLMGDTPCYTILPSTLSLLKDKESIKGNVEKAIELFEEGLKELGLTRETFPVVTISYCTYGSQKSLTELLQESLHKTLGIQINIQSFEWNVLSDHMIHGQFQMASCTRNAAFDDPIYFLDIFKEKNRSYNFSRWENDSYKQLLNAATASADPLEREATLRQAEDLLMDEMPVISLYMETCKYLIQDKLKGYFINNSGYVDFKTMALEN